MLMEEITVKTIVREIQADLETPVSVYLKLRGQGESFLLESIDGGERIARYSFIGIAPRAKYILRSDGIHVIENGAERLSLHRRSARRFGSGAWPLSLNPQPACRALSVAWSATLGMKR